MMVSDREEQEVSQPEEQLAERQVKALESIAASLEKLANPTLVVEPDPDSVATGPEMGPCTVCQGYRRLADGLCVDCMPRQAEDPTRHGFTDDNGMMAAQGRGRIVRTRYGASPYEVVMPAAGEVKADPGAPPCVYGCEERCMETGRVRSCPRGFRPRGIQP